MLAHAVESYVALRRATGLVFRSEGALLKNFATFSDGRGESHVRAPIVIE